jgi:uncharacterized 2Fe-2S/4Fe-4S cluster protein (DUF4445 family)
VRAGSRGFSKEAQHLTVAVVVRAHFGDQLQIIQATPGASVRQVLEDTDLRVRTGCNGNGSCGLCRVRILSGPVSPPTSEEKLNLDSALVEAGLRLSCQVVPLGDVEVEVVDLAPRSAWRPIAPEALRSPARPGVTGVSGPARISRIAIDVGTTNIGLAFWGEESRGRLAARRGLNPQSRFGSDVVTRLQAAHDPVVARDLAHAVELAVAEALREMVVSDGFEVAARPTVVAVGNTAMLSLLHGSQGRLLDPESWAGPATWLSEKQLHWRLGAGCEAVVQVVQPLAGFVGSDLLAAVLAANLLQGEVPALLLDFGTNTEIALWDGETLWVTSAAGGPAFEGSGVRCAVPADTGAISRVRAGTPLHFEVMGGGPPTGVCGSGLVDWVACLRRTGLLSSRGNLVDGAAEEALSLGGKGSEIILCKRDVDVFQRAKAAIAAGVQLLARRAGVECQNLRRIVTTGLFGRSLDVTNAQAIGLLPSIAPQRVETYDNLALAGCEIVLTSPEGARAVEAVRGRARLMNLGQCAEFEDLFVQSLFLAPVGVEP